MKDRIIVEKSLIPYQMEIALPSELFNLYFNYNKKADLFTATLYKDNELISTDPIIYNVPLFSDVYQSGTYPVLEIVPTDESKEQKEVTWDNFGTTVFLTIYDDGEDYE